MSLINVKFQELLLFFVQYLMFNDLFSQIQMLSIASRYKTMHEIYYNNFTIFLYVTILKFCLRIIEQNSYNFNFKISYKQSY